MKKGELISLKMHKYFIIIKMKNHKESRIFTEEKV
jgi:hypothetical protein